MSGDLFANRSPATTSDTDAERARGQASSRPFSTAGPAARMLLGLQRAAGNASVVQLLERGALPTLQRVSTGAASGFPTAPEPATGGSTNEEIDERQQAAEARPAEAAEGGGSVEIEPPVDDPNREHPADERAAKEAEGDEVSLMDELVPAEGGPPPVAAGEGGGNGFVGGGHRGSVPFTGADDADLDPGPGEEPHAFVRGAAGKIPWAGGGGHGKGPVGLQRSGSIQHQVPPKYESSRFDPTSNADAWVNPETGLVTVLREYMTSSAGDQGPGGWWVSPQAAPALKQHEEKHVSSSRGHYEAAIEPVLDRIVRSVDIGKGKFYLASHAELYLQGQIGWKKGLEKFHEDDEQDNQPMGTIDNEDFGSAHYPIELVRDDQGETVHGGTVSGKPYQNLLKMKGENIPDLLPLDEEPGHGRGQRQ